MTGFGRRAFVRNLSTLGVAATGLVVLDGCGLLVPTAAKPARIPRVGYLGDPPDSPSVAGLSGGLRELGWVDGQSVSIERREQVETDNSALIAELVSLPVDVLVTVGTPSTAAAKRATTSIAIVFTNVGDPVGDGIVVSLGRPEANVTGVSTGVSGQLWAKRVELLKAVVPPLVHLAYVGAPPEDSPRTAPVWAEIQAAAEILGVEVQRLPVGSADDLARAIATATLWPAQGLMFGSNVVTVNHRALIAELAARSHLPAIYGFTEFVQAGGLMSYGPSTRATHRHAAAFVDRILRGAKPGDLPVEQLTTIELVVNVKALQELGLTLPSGIAAQVTVWVE
jgi:putative ABC transport system substrate-binding protein